MAKNGYSQMAIDNGFVCCCRVYSYVETASLGFTTMLLGLLNLG
jgi:hypothetical protein